MGLMSFTEIQLWFWLRTSTAIDFILCTLVHCLWCVVGGRFIQSCYKQRRREWTFISRDTFVSRARAFCSNEKSNTWKVQCGSRREAFLLRASLVSCWESSDCCDVLTAPRHSTKDFGFMRPVWPSELSMFTFHKPCVVWVERNTGSCVSKRRGRISAAVGEAPSSLARFFAALQIFTVLVNLFFFPAF